MADISTITVKGTTYNIKDAKARQDIAQAQIDIQSMIAAVGTPLTASTAAGMTDHDKIYVYVGSETGYTNGHWYYWDGSAWADGGVYNSTAFETDKTLSVENMAADAEAAGTKIGELKSATKNVVILPTLRNGSAANAGNANAVCPSDVIPTYGADRITVLIKKEMSAEANYRRFQYSTYSRSSGRPQDGDRIIGDANHDTTDIGFTLTKQMYGNAVGFVVAYYEMADASTWIPVRITDFSSGDYIVIYEFNYSGEPVLRSRFNGRKISIIGDSIETYNQPGYKLSGYQMYYPALGVDDVNKCWWKQVIDTSSAALEVNASWSGSRVTNTHPTSTFPDFYDRINVVGSPDIIFVTLGTNDSAYNVSLGEYDFETEYTELSESTFRTAYIKGVKGLKALHPNAEIVCIAEQMGDGYKDSIAYIAETLSCTFIDASDYIGQSGVHPGVKGMLQIASLVLYPTDDRLKQKHFPADAEATGTAIAELQSDISTSLQLDYPNENVIVLENETNIDNLLKAGNYAVTSASAAGSMLGTPPFTSTPYKLIVCNTTGTNRKVQIAIGNTTVNTIKYRNLFTNDGVWTEWRTLATDSDITTINNKFANYASLNNAVGVQGIPNNTDYDTLTTAGNYVVTSASSATGMVHCPTTNPHRLSVVLTTASNRIVQIILTNDESPQIYKRFFNGTWSTWSRILDSDPGSNYSVSTDFRKQRLNLVEMGVLSAIQAFCIYDGKYYSTNGSTLYEQDENLTLLSSTPLDLGHGNALQLGHNGIAYASGWNDSKVYAVNLTNKTIVNTINLPVTGYSTCAVDDINGLVYIFNRSTSPSTDDIYDFVVYDYINSSVVSSKKITRAIGGMQACDFLDGRIFVVYGLGTTAVPNGYIILNTNGDIIGEYIIGSKSTSEPEGVFVDRNTYDVYISYVNQRVYKLVN